MCECCYIIDIKIVLRGIFMYSQIKSFGFSGLCTFCVNVEVDISKGLPAFDIVGLPDTTVKESKDRVRSSIKNCNFTFPVSKITVNLAPANIKKNGPVYDLPILIGILKASKQFDYDIKEFSFFGELSLNGYIRGIDGALPMILAAHKNGIKNIFVPKDNAIESSVIKELNIYTVEHINDIINHFNGTSIITPFINEDYSENNQQLFDFKDVKGQNNAKFALEIAAAGGHNVLMIGPPGSGKSMLAKRLPSILPTMTFDEMIETTILHSIAGNLNGTNNGLIHQRPFRSPHHTISSVGLSGGGSNPKPGEVSLSHNGVLFLDEFPEFSRSSIEILRQPIEDNSISIVRANTSVTYPANMMVVAAMNPCPCGHFSHPTKECICSPHTIKRYLNKISGPILDRFDIHIEVPSISYDDITSIKDEESSHFIKKRVDVARQRQLFRYKNYDIKSNAKINSAMIKEFCKLDSDAELVLKMAFKKLSLSARAYDKVLKAALTLSDLDKNDKITKQNIISAISYRSLDQKYWQSI